MTRTLFLAVAVALLSGCVADWPGGPVGPPIVQTPSDDDIDLPPPVRLP